MAGVHRFTVCRRDRWIDGFCSWLPYRTEHGPEQQQLQAYATFGLEQPGSRLLLKLLIRGLGHLLGKDAFGHLTDLLAINLNHLARIVSIAGRHPERCVSSQ